MTDPAPALRLENVALAAGSRPLVSGVSLSLPKGRTLAVVGESGCGKSLTAMSVIGLLPPGVTRAGGRIWLDGVDLASLSEREMRALRGERIGFIFQEPVAALDPLATVGAQFVEAVRAHRKVSRREAEAMALKMLESVGVNEPARRLRQYPFELSGGMSQRVTIAMALALEPAVLVADEPTTALDVTVQAQILDLMATIQQQHGTAILLITHDMGVVSEVADTVAVMYAGAVVETGDVERVLERPAHPYTRLLLESVIGEDAVPKTPLPTIEGAVPRAGAGERGCAFRARCPLAIGRCAEEAPVLADVAGGGSVACWRAGAHAAA
jgi:peptide/nickel transport system ATP-binding protein